MRLLIRAALQNRRHYTLIVFTIISMLAMTVTTQMEMLSLGLLTETGADFFALFAPKKGAVLVPDDRVRWSDLESRWPEIDTRDRGVITKKEASAYLSQNGQNNLIANFIHYLEETFHLSNRFALMIILLVTICACKAVAIFGSKYFTKLVSIRVSRDLRLRYFEHLQKLPMPFYHEHNTGALSSRVVVDATAIATAINAALMNYLQTPFLVISTGVLCFYLSPQLTMIVFLGLPLIFFPVLRIAQKIRKVTRSIQKNQEHFTSVLIDFLSGIQTIKLFAMYRFSLHKYQDHNDQMAKLEERSNRYDCLVRPILHLLGGLFLATVLLYGIYVLEMSMSALLVFVGLLFQVYEPIKKFSEENYQIQKGVVAADRMFEVLHVRDEMQERKGLIEFDGEFESLEFKDVWFRYGQEWVLKGLSFRIERGQVFAIVGPTGSGKSTIVQLIPRLFEIERGEILLNGRPVQEYTLASLRRHVSFVTQRPFLFLASIHDNIAVGQELAAEEVERAACRAHASEFINRMPEKYGSMVIESGRNLSGGQQQRLAIARALSRQAALLLMDEATSSLDAVSEQHIKETMLDLQGSITQLIIAHRFSTIEHADQILYLEHGQKIAQGTLSDLLKECPPFLKMWELMQLSS